MKLSKFFKNKRFIKFKLPFRSKNLNSKKRRRFSWRTLFVFIGYSIIGILLCTAVTFAWFAKDLPTPGKIASRRPTESTKIYDRTGQILLFETGEQKRTVVGSDRISQYLKDATVATEDTNFYNHYGFDGRAIISAVTEKVLDRTNRTRGGSTITQQYVKNALLNSNRSLTRKIKELILAIELEFMYDKETILVAYLNEIPYGSNTAGAEAASRMYYNKPASDLTIAQAATLAAIPKAPTYYSPYGTHVKNLNERKNYVLDRMVDTGKISTEEAKKAKQEDTTTLGSAIRPRHDSILAPHFAMYVLEQIADEYGEDKVQKEGLKIITTLDYDKQKMAEDAIQTGADKFTRYGASNAALVAIDPKTGQILAMVGSKDYFDTNIDGNVNVADSARQPGSSFKPFAYATAFKKKEFSPSHLLFDLQTDFGGGYVPQNYNGKFNGPVTMRQALANSLNIPAVKVMSLATIDNVLRTAGDMGITTLTQRDRYGLSLVLGSGEVKPIEMAGAFGVFSQGGVKHDLIYAVKVTDSQGKVLEEYKPENDIGRKVLDPQIAYEITSILSDNDARSLVFGTRTALYFPDRPVAVKTGTTSDFKDAWAVGYTPSLSVAVWVGNSNAAKMYTGADGSVIAAPIFHNFLNKALANIKAEEFIRPEGITEMEVEKYSNKLPTQYSSEKVRDIFASWQVPTDPDDAHVPLRLCRGDYKLAPEGMPDSLVENRVITIIHSERPDNPSWEGPVRGWAEANGFAATATPTEYCNIDEFKPSISITSPLDKTSVSGDIQITAQASSLNKVTSVEFFIDDISIGAIDAEPYSIHYNTSNLSANSGHKISAMVTDENGVSAKSEINITVAKDAIPPSISAPSASYNSTSAIISWPTDEDSTTRVVYDIETHTNLNEYALSTPLISILTRSHSASLNGLQPQTKYYYRVISVDASGNSAYSSERNFTTSQ